MATYKELKAQLAELERQAAIARQQEFETVLADIRAKVAEFGYTQQDIFGSRRGRSGLSHGAAPPKYRDRKRCDLVRQGTRTELDQGRQESRPVFDKRVSCTVSADGDRRYPQNRSRSGRRRKSSETGTLARTTSSIDRGTPAANP